MTDIISLLLWFWEELLPSPSHNSLWEGRGNRLRLLVGTPPKPLLGRYTYKEVGQNISATRDRTGDTETNGIGEDPAVASWREMATS